MGEDVRELGGGSVGRDHDDVLHERPRGWGARRGAGHAEALTRGRRDNNGGRPGLHGAPPKVAAGDTLRPLQQLNRGDREDGEKWGGDGVARWGPTTCAQHSSRPLGLDKYLLSLFETLTQNVKA